MAWFITQHGFTSVVAYDARKDKSKTTQHKAIAPNPGTHLLVRARVEEDLEVLRQVCPGLVIETDRHADYSYRAVLSRELFKSYLALEIDQIGYGAHFKEAFRDAAHEGKSRYSALMNFWHGHAAWQRFAPYAGTDRWAKSSKSKPKQHSWQSNSNSQSSLYADNGWDEYDAAEAAGSLKVAEPVTVDRLKTIIGSHGFDALTLSDWANMDKDALALAERIESIDDLDTLSRTDLDAHALEVVWEGSTDAEKEIWVDAGADLPQSPEARAEVEEISIRLANQS